MRTLHSFTAVIARTIRPCWVTLCAAVLALAIGTLLTRADDTVQVDQFLARLGLTDLRLLNFERQLARAPADKQLPLARSLADLYAEELISAADEPERFNKLHGRFEKLLDQHPTASTSAIEIVRLQAEYQRAEVLMLRWLEEADDKSLLAPAVDILAKVQPQLAARQAEIAAAVESEAEAVDKIRSDEQRQLAEQRLQRARGLAARADFFAGWAAYYLGVARQNPAAAQSDYATAKQHFLRLLDVTDDKDYSTIEVEALGLESIWRSRAVIGLGLTELGLKRQAAAQTVFAWLRQPSVPSVLRDQAAYWQLRGLLNAGLTREASQFVASEAAAFSTSASPGKSSLAIMAIRAGARASGDERRQLIDAGVLGLARMRQFDTLDKLIDQYKLDKGGSAGDFHFAWLRGRREYLMAEKAKQAEGFRAAAETLTSALARPEARTNVVEAGQARYYLAWSRFRLNELESAARLFAEAATALRSSSSELVLQAAWMNCTCLVQLAAKDKRQSAAAIAALTAFKQEYPSADEAQQAELLLARLRQTHSDPQEALRQLAAIKPGDRTYESAQYEICQLRYQLWSKDKSDAAKTEPLAAELLLAVERYLSLARGELQTERRLKATLLAIDVLQSAATPDRKRIAAMLTGASKTADSQSPDSLPVIEYQYRRLQLAQSQGDTTALQAAARTIAEHGQGTPYELPALVIRARAADEAAASAGGADQAAKRREAAGLYERIVKLLGDSLAILQAHKNAFAAASKLAQYDEELGKWPAAADRLVRLAEAQPRDRRLLRRAGLACYQAGRPKESLEYWRTLLSGIDSGASEWWEAKYYQLACLEKTDLPAAQQVYKQFKVLYPEVKSAAWRDRFAELESKLK